MMSRLACAALLSGLLAIPVVATACPAPPPAVRDLDLPRFYGDAEGSKVDPELARRHKAAVEPLTAFLRQVVADTDKAVRRRDGKAAACPLAWIAAWAKGEAWLGHMGTKQAEYQRKWDLAGVALAYLKLKPYASPAERKAIEPWLVRFADTVKAFQLDPARKRNNHLYWLGLALAATAIAADSPRHWEDARRIFAEAAGHIGPEGTLPLELERGARALHYHAFAVTPLVAMAELAALRGEDWYRMGGGALHRLVALATQGLVDPAAFDRLAGVAQERPPGMGAGWLTLYGKRFPARLPKELPAVPDKHRWLGGDVRLLAAALGDPA
ncbi:MAG: alginate lyase family protein [Hyphomicrobiaceae bacterium]